ncbi:Vesicle transport protein GOT1A [Larimichthys crocea]|uniref:Uncharacterized protein n=1 Tax=Larimichthys crocea TaxID=215358 RepID=A0ACD3RIL3_LARCR|nr:Vesicle transport protein GOT1A [Larimichthys crocea]
MGEREQQRLSEEEKEQDGGEEQREQHEVTQAQPASVREHSDEEEPQQTATAIMNLMARPDSNVIWRNEESDKYVIIHNKTIMSYFFLHLPLTWSEVFTLKSKILFLNGLTFIIGFKRTAHFFFQRHKFRGSFFFLGGVSLVLCRWPIIGLLVESYGFVLLFRSFFPMALGFVLSAVNIPFLNAFISSSTSMV